HFQLQDGQPDPRSLTRPLPRFARHATEVTVNLEQSRDGLVRAMRSSWRHDGVEIPSIFSIDTSLPAGTLTGIDFSISPSSFESVSFSDLLNGRIAPEALRGKSVFVGATAVELRDVVPVPVYRTLPGVVVQALAAETVRAGPLRTAPLWLLAVLLAATAGGAVRLMQRNTWRRNLLWLAAADTSFAAVSLYLHAVHRIDFPIVPFALVVATAFAAATLRSLDVETLRALAYA